MIHRGEIVAKRIKESGIAISVVAKNCNLVRQTLHRYFEDPNMDLDLILKIGKFIKHDFGVDIKELRNPAADDNLDWKLKYIELAEKYMKLQEEQAEYLKAGKKR